MATVNEEFLDAVIRHQIYLMRLSGGIRNEITTLLNNTEKDLAVNIRERLLNHKGIGTPSSVRKLKALENYVRSVRLKAWEQIDDKWIEEITALAVAEPTTIGAALKTVSPVLLNLSLPAPSLLKALATENPFEGRTLKEWSRGIREADIRRIMDQIKIGMVQGESSQAIARRVVGTARLNGVDGVTEITRRQAAAITRTAVNHIANAAKREFYKENKELFEGEIYVATLDSRTTPICRSLDGKIYEVGQGPIPPLHFNCRSLRVGVIDGKVLGERPSKPVSEKGLLREYARDKKLERVPRSRKDLPFGHKGTFDNFSATRTRQLTGQVPAKVTYQEWLSRQSKEFQEDVLGVTKAKLFRSGNLTLDKFVNRAGDELNLKELAVKHKDAFKAAGLDPEDFLE